MVGSVPAAFAGVLVLRQLGDGAVVQDRIKLTLGVALLLAAASIAAKGLLEVQARRTAPGGRSADRPFQVRPLPTVLIGVTGGLVVGMTSVGSGSLMIVLLLLLYPMLSSSRLVGTDLVQAIPLVASAALGHLLFGDFRLDLTSSLLVGSLPGVSASWSRSPTSGSSARTWRSRWWGRSRPSRPAAAGRPGRGDPPQVVGAPRVYWPAPG